MTAPARFTPNTMRAPSAHDNRPLSRSHLRKVTEIICLALSLLFPPLLTADIKMMTGAQNELHRPGAAKAAARPGKTAKLARKRQALARQLERDQRARTRRVNAYTTKLDPGRLKQWAREGISVRDVVNGIPRFAGPDNREAALSSLTNRVRGQSAFLGVDGSGMTVGVWEGGIGPGNSHAEWSDRYSYFDGTGLGGSGHAAHVIGTIAASGLNARGMGMAPAVTVRGYDKQDDQSEMLAEAAADPSDFFDRNRLLLSNHSYGNRVSWRRIRSSNTFRWYGPWPPGEDPAFGQYDAEAAAWDAICHVSPYYLPFKSAGNDRSRGGPAKGGTYQRLSVDDDDDPIWEDVADFTPGSASHPPEGSSTPDDGYDTMPGFNISKNIVSVGAVDDAVFPNPVLGPQRFILNADMTTFSGWGPADDGRIKPDIVANGQDVYSTWNRFNDDDQLTEHFSTESGTSMATPTACGSAVLLYEYFIERFPDTVMRSATMKGLIIHNTDDLGNAGPDYQNGWGLMNTLRCANHIAAHADNTFFARIFESTLDENDEHVFSLYWDQDASRMRVTLCYTDPPGAPQMGLDNRTPVLVNDLDIFLEAPDGSLHRPFMLDPDNPANLATTGDNDVDNVEQIVVENPTPGRYELRLSHEGDLLDPNQDYSLLLSGHHVIPIAPTPVAVRENRPLNQDYDDPDLALAAQGWSYASTNSGRVAVGGGVLRMDDAGIDGGDDATNAATLHLDLKDQQNVILEFSWRDYFDSPAAVPSSFTGLPPADGVAFSADGGTTYHRVISLPVDQWHDWRRERIELTPLIDAVGITDHSDVRLRFMQHGTLPISNNGIDYDRIQVSIGNAGKFAFSTRDLPPGDNPEVHALETSGSLTFEVQRLEGTEGSATITYGTLNGTALHPSDYSSKSKTLSFSEGEEFKTFSVSIVDDVSLEDSEYFDLQLSNPTNGSELFAERTRLRVHIVDDDSPSKMEVDPVELNPVTSLGGNAASQSIVMRNIAGGTLRYSISGDQSWISIAEGNSGEVSQGQFGRATVDYLTDSLLPGRHFGEIEVTDLDGNNAPQVIPATLLVGYEGSLVSEGTAQASVQLPGQADGKASAWPMTIDIPETPGRILDTMVVLAALQHDQMDDLDLVVVSPDGVPVGVLSDVAGGSAFGTSDLTALRGEPSFPALGALDEPGLYAPTDHEPALAELPVGGGAPEWWFSELGDFNGATPGGTWNVYAGDDTPASGNGTLGKAALILRTAVIEDVVAEVFDALNNPFGLAGQSLMFTPNPEIPAGYEVSRYEITELPIPAGGSTISPPKNGHKVFTLTPHLFWFYGREYSILYIGEDGGVAFADVDSQANGSDFTAYPRLSVLGMDFINGSGVIQVDERIDRIVITWTEMKDVGTGNLATFQVELFHDERIRFSYPDVDKLSSGTVGLSRGDGEAWSTNYSALTETAPSQVVELRGWNVNPTGEKMSLTFPSEPNVIYVLETSEDHHNWKPIRQVIGTGDVIACDIPLPIPNTIRQFYRVRRSTQTGL